MRRTTPLTATTLLGLALLSPTPAGAAGETCRGEAATIVGTSQEVPLLGTEGRDVIVTSRAQRVFALGGDDLICVVPDRTHSDSVSVDAGAGADVVDSTGSRSDYHHPIALGTGADTFAGGPAMEYVSTAGTFSESEYESTLKVDDDRDVVEAGAGNDGVTTGSATGPSNDRVDTGPGDDFLTLATVSFTSDALLSGGGDRDRLVLHEPVPGDIVLDMSTGTLTTADGGVALAQLEDADLRVGSQRLTYRGTPDADSLTVTPYDGVPTLDVTTLAGDDQVVVEYGVLAAGSRLDAGTGRDLFKATDSTARLEVDLSRDTIGFDDLSVPAAGFESARLRAPEVEMVGDDAANRFLWDACDATLRGGKGDDALINRYDTTYKEYLFSCPSRVVSMDGGDGRDRLRGSPADDRLVGGPGHDLLQGRYGDDLLRGGPGDDRLDGGERRDDLRGGSGDDDLRGRGGEDTLVGGGGRDRGDGAKGADVCRLERERRCEG